MASIEDKAQDMMLTIKHHDMYYVEEDFLDHDDILNALDNNKNLIRIMGGTNSIIDKYNKWLSNEWQPLDAKFRIKSRGGMCRVVLVLGRFNMIEFKVGDYFNTKKGKFKIELISDRFIHYKFKAKDTRCEVDEEFFELNRNDNYFL
jgi:hypothetical protein